MTGNGDKFGWARRLRGLSLALMLILFPQALFAQKSSEQANLASFIRDVQRFAEKKQSWRRSDSPLAPYFIVPLETGLINSERDDLAGLEASGDCLRVHELLVTGFKRLYPALAPAFDDNSVRSTLQVAFGASRLPANLRCQARKQRQQALAALSSEPVRPISLSLALGGRGKVPEASGPLRQLALAWFELGILAFCHGDKAAGEYVLKFANKAGGMMLSGTEKPHLESGPEQPSTIPASGYWHDACAVYRKSQEVSTRG